MDYKIIKNIRNYYTYFKILNNINIYLTEIIHQNENRDLEKVEDLFYKITSEIIRLMPYEEKEEVLEIKKDGILKLPNTKEIKEGYNKIITSGHYQKVLKDIKFIRNKYIHEPHNISFAYSVEGTTTCSMGMYYKSQLLSISTISLTPIVSYLNQIFEVVRKTIIRECEDETEIISKIKKMNFSKEKWNYTNLPEYLIWGFNEK